MQNFLQEKILNMSKAIETGRSRQTEAQKSQKEQFHLRQTYMALKLKQKDAARMMHSTSRQVEEIDLHYFLVRTDWAAFIRILQVLQLIYSGVKNYVKEQSPLYRRITLKVKVRYLVKKFLKRRQLEKPQADLQKSQSSISLAAGLFRDKVYSEARSKLGPLFYKFNRAYRLKSRLMSYNLACRISNYTQAEKC